MKSTTQNLLLTVFLLSIASAHAHQLAQDTTASDTLKGDAVKKHSNMSLTARIHSLGFFGYGGVLVANNPVADINFTWSYKSAGALFIKATDLEDLHADYNFSVAFLYNRFALTPKLSVTPYAGFVFDQSVHLCGPGSDAMLLLITAWKPHPKIAIEHLARFSNLAVERSQLDWVNRARVSFSSHRFDASITTWVNNHVFDSDDYTSLAFSAAYARVPVANHVMLTTGVTALVTAAATPETHFAKKNGLMLTIAATVD
jgi:hypothetical protein